ncbi:hypothetical protein IWX90DRAFT_58799 [Phyllosticta citrichinensis]|uniref:Uncharacterized protein n=1 Tax=Phyllosticta citrichinensis TaxID=1130410 RepID=A0ABR1XGX6_9PEZI
MCWFPFLSRPRGVNGKPKTNHKHYDKRQRDDSSLLLGPRLAAAAPTTTATHHGCRVPLSLGLPSHLPATSQTSLTPHHHHQPYHNHQQTYLVRQTQPYPQPARNARAPAVLSGTGVKRAPPRAWDEWDDEALDRQLRRRRYSPAEQAQEREWYQYRQNEYGEQHPRPRHRANSSARRQRPIIDIGAHGNGTSFAARAQRGGRGALDDVFRAAMYDGGGDVAVRVAAPVGGRRRGRRGGSGTGAGAGGGAREGGYGYGVGVGARERPWPPAGGLGAWM